MNFTIEGFVLSILGRIAIAIMGKVAIASNLMEKSSDQSKSEDTIFYPKFGIKRKL